jgi:hypothetical protein
MTRQKHIDVGLDGNKFMTITQFKLHLCPTWPIILVK